MSALPFANVVEEAVATISRAYGDDAEARYREEGDYSPLAESVVQRLAEAFRALPSEEAPKKKGKLDIRELPELMLRLVQAADSLQELPTDKCQGIDVTGAVCGTSLKREPFRTHSRCATHLDDAWFARLHAMVCGEPLNYSVTDKCRICCDEVEPEGEEVNPSCALCGSVVHGHCYSSFAEQGQLNVKEGEAVVFTCAECTLLHWVPCVLLQALAGWGDATVGPSGKKLVVLPLWEDAPEWLKKLYENKFLVQVRQGNTPEWLVAEQREVTRSANRTPLKAVTPVSKGKSKVKVTTAKGDLAAQRARLLGRRAGLVSGAETQDSDGDTEDDSSDDDLASAQTEFEPQPVPRAAAGTSKRGRRGLGTSVVSPTRTLALVETALERLGTGTGMHPYRASLETRNSLLGMVITGEAHGSSAGKEGSLDSPLAPSQEPYLAMPETPIGQKLVSRILGAKRADLVTVDRSTPEAQNLASLTLGEDSTIQLRQSKFGVPRKDVVVCWLRERSEEVRACLSSGLECFTPGKARAEECALNALLIVGRYELLLCAIDYFSFRWPQDWEVVWRYLLNCVRDQFRATGVHWDRQSTVIAQTAAVQDPTERRQCFADMASGGVLLHHLQDAKETVAKNRQTPAPALPAPDAKPAQKPRASCPLCYDKSCAYSEGNWKHADQSLIVKPCPRKLGDGKQCGKLHAFKGPLQTPCREAVGKK